MRNPISLLILFALAIRIPPFCIVYSACFIMEMLLYYTKSEGYNALQIGYENFGRSI